MGIIIDVTQLMAWEGKLTGIPRVMYELSKRFSIHEQAIQFVIWDYSRSLFSEVTYDDIELSRVDTPVLTAQIPHYPLKRTLHKVYNSTPLIVQRSARKVKKFINKENDTPNTAFIFNKGDKLLIAWGDWGNDAYRSSIVSLNKNNTIEIYQISYDMLPLITPQYSSHSTIPLERYVTDIYPICRKIIAISEHTKEDVSKWMKDKKLKVPEIELIRLGDDFTKKYSQKPSLDFFNSKNLEYIICVGTIETRKNHTLLYYVYKLAKARGVVLPKVVVVGRRGWLTENIYELITTDPETKDSFVFTHDSSDEELAWMYEHSLFSIYPSHYEGWGLPIAESISYGIPPIASNTSSMPEIAGDLITYFSPVSTDECLKAIQWMLNTNNLNTAKNKLHQYKTTSWQDTFEQTRRIIES